MQSLVYTKNTHFCPSTKSGTSLKTLKAANSSGKDKVLPLNIKVLMVEDDKLCQTIQAKLLESYGCRVDIASDGKQALTLFSSHYDVVLLDVNLPDISGLEVSRAIRARKEGKTIPIIGVTSEAGGIEAKCLEAGYTQVLAKSDCTQKLERVLREHFPVNRQSS